MKYAATFQQRYRDDEHPRLGMVDEKSFLIVDEDSEERARRALSLATAGSETAVGDYAFIYDYDDDFRLNQVYKYHLQALPYRIVPGGSKCGSPWVFIKKVNDIVTVLGCICHTDMTDMETCSWCTTEWPDGILSEFPDGARICPLCAVGICEICGAWDGIHTDEDCFK